MLQKCQALKLVEEVHGSGFQQHELILLKL
jgi:hypothetical protein